MEIETGLAASRLTFATYQELADDFEARGLTDGLPVIAPTVSAVADAIDACGRGAGESLGAMPPTWAEATVERVAINAVMAGCRPEYLPVVMAAVEAVLDPAYNLYGVQATTHSCAPFILVSGGYAAAIGLNAGAGAFGPGARANATIGRALRLCLLNIGGGRPGSTDMSTQGSPAKYAYCVAENETESPWEPHRATLGYEPGENVVTVGALEPPHNIHDHASTSGEQLLKTIAGTMATSGSNCLYLSGTDSFLFLCPEHAQLLHADGFSKADVREYLAVHARVRFDQFGDELLAFFRRRHLANDLCAELDLANPDAFDMPMIARPTDLQVIVLGGSGKHSAWAPPTALGKAVTRRFAAPGSN
jgi:hypothetical protein